jgi:hypothetical protein
MLANGAQHQKRKLQDDLVKPYRSMSAVRLKLCCSESIAIHITKVNNLLPNAT